MSWFSFPRSREDERMTIRTDLTRDPVDPAFLIDRARTPATGGIVTFVGIVRDDSLEALEMEVYEKMAREDLARIAREATDRFGLTTTTVIHRYGHLEVGETILVIVCGASHRKEAFSGCEWILEQIKKVVPIWKQEIRSTGRSWVRGYSEE